MFLKNFYVFPEDVMQYSTQILAKIYKARLKENAYHKIQQHSYPN